MTQEQNGFQDSPFASSLSALLLAFTGAVFGAVILLFGSPFPGHLQSLNQVLPEFFIWFTLIIFLTSLLTLFSVPLWLSLNPLRPFFTHHKLTILLATIIAALLFLAPIPFARQLSTIPRSPLLYHSLKVNIINLFALAAILPAIIGIQLIDVALQTTFSSINSITAEKEQIELMQRHRHYRRGLQRYISVLGILIGIVTLATGALRNLVIANSGVPKEDYPITIVLMYGLYYTAVLILLYAPTFFRLTETGRALRDQIVPLKSIESLSHVYKQRQEIDMILQLNVTTGQSVRTAVAILTPLLSGLLTALLS